MDDDLVLLLVVIGTGVALAALIMSQLSGFKNEMRSELAELRRELNSLGNRVARLEEVIDMIKPWQHGTTSAHDGHELLDRPSWNREAPKTLSGS